MVSLTLMVTVNGILLAGMSVFLYLWFRNRQNTAALSQRVEVLEKDRPAIDQFAGDAFSWLNMMVPHSVDNAVGPAVEKYVDGVLKPQMQFALLSALGSEISKATRDEFKSRIAKNCTKEKLESAMSLEVRAAVRDIVAEKKVRAHIADAVQRAVRNAVAAEMPAKRSSDLGMKKSSVPRTKVAEMEAVLVGN